MATFGEILKAEADRIDKIVRHAQETSQHPNFLYCLFQAHNAMIYAAGIAERMDKDGGLVPEGYDTQAMKAQFCDFIDTLPGQSRNKIR